MIASDSTKIILIGDSGSGKTSLIQKYVNNAFNVGFPSTIEPDLQLKKIEIDEKTITMQLWDTAGQERYKALPNNYYRNTHCCMLIFDVTSMSSYHHLHDWRDEFIGKASPREPSKFPFVLIGNKIDMDDRVVSTIVAKTWCELRNNIPYFECSAKTNLNVEKAFETVARLALQQKEREARLQSTIVEGELVKGGESSTSPVEKEKKASFKSHLERALSRRHTGPSKEQECGADGFIEEEGGNENNGDDDELPQIEDDAIEQGDDDPGMVRNQSFVQQTHISMKVINLHVDNTTNITTSKCC